ncbi:uncharacterized protein LOC103697215 isoform X1 [Phoenix dactylifera]|uniref:Uncharacterized protein LOC103697215 isoform X1 n=1 Tax=Phoenix dactylifera TaxID=42345 RepID=A0A8B9AHR6_PHODC|nr:uncharacterized protein LOC103697215 isoform X1 [Phoenix dactylifera]
MASSSSAGHSNLQSFINSTTPSVPSHTLPKRSLEDWNSLWLPAGRDTVECFNLRDLWGQYTEWSAYGAGAEVLLHGGDIVDQYYVPYLSAIQIYTNKSRASSRNGASNCWSNGSAYRTLVDPRGSAVQEDAGLHHEGIRRAQEQFGYLYFEFIENNTPFGRPPLLEKVRELASIHPGLMSFESAELSPASWMSVAWYPIYHIPARPKVKDLSACFLTYHKLTSSCQDHMQGSTAEGVSCTRGGNRSSSSEGKSNHIALYPFGLATYRARGKLWTNPESGDDERVVSLYNAADSWLRQLEVVHNDFNFFSTH